MSLQKNITIGITGHPGHGKSALAAYIANGPLVVDGRGKEQFYSGRTEILEWRPAPGRSISLMDVPGHPRLLKNAIRGLSAVDFCILVVAADDGVMPQTLEHIKIIQHLNIPAGLIVLSKADLVDSETLELAELEIREAIQNTVLADKPVIPFSAVTGTGRDALIDQIQEVAAAVPDKNPDAD